MSFRLFLFIRELLQIPIQDHLEGFIGDFLFTVQLDDRDKLLENLVHLQEVGLVATHTEIHVDLIIFGFAESKVTNAHVIWEIERRVFDFLLFTVAIRISMIVDVLCIYDIDKVCVHIFQPRKSNVVCSMMEKTDLYKWADTELTQKAQLAYEGQGDFSCGEWCRFCKAKAECRERAAANLALARYEFQSPALLDDEEIADILGKIDALTAWASDVKEYALQQAVSGKEWAGWKLVEGRSNRKYTSEAAVAAAVESAGFDPYERKVLGVTAMQKLLGKTRFEELLAPYIEKPQGKPTLVPESDKRPAMNTAKNDFMEEF